MRYVSIVLASLSLAGVAVAQSGAPVTQTSSPARQVQVSSPYWNQGPSQASDLPAAEIRAVPAAHAAAVQARWTYIQTGTDLSNAVRVMQMQMELRPEYVKAVADEKAAYDALEAARRNALAPLADNAFRQGESNGELAQIGRRRHHHRVRDTVIHQRHRTFVHHHIGTDLGRLATVAANFHGHAAGRRIGEQIIHVCQSRACVNPRQRRLNRRSAP